MKRILFIYLIAVVFSIFGAKAQEFKNLWVNDIGGTGRAISTSVSTGPDGNIYITGRMSGTIAFNLNQGGTEQLTSHQGSDDIFIAKYEPAAGDFVWAINFPGEGNQHSSDIEVDKDGNVIIVGQFGSAVNFNPKGSFVLTPVSGAEDVYFAKYDTNGNFLWAKSLGETGTDRGFELDSDNNGNIFISGIFQASLDVDPSAATHFLTSDIDGFSSNFFAKYDSNGNYVWAHAISEGYDGNPVVRIAVDPQTQDVVIFGTLNNRFDFSFNNNVPGATVGGSGIGLYVAKYSNNGTYKWVKYIPYSSIALCSVVTVTKQSDIVVSCVFTGDFYPDGLTGIKQSSTISNISLFTYTSGGNLKWAKQLGSDNSEININHQAADDNGNIFLTGSFTGSINFDPFSLNGTLTAYEGEKNIFMAKYTANGLPVKYSSLPGICQGNLLYRCEVFGENLYMVGGFCSTVDFDPASCTIKYVTALHEETDMFLAAYKIDDTPVYINTITPPAVTSFCLSGTVDKIVGNSPDVSGATYQWQSSDNGQSFSNIPGAVNKDYTPGNITANMYYRRIVNVPGCDAPELSNAIGIRVIRAITNNSIFTNNSTFCGRSSPVPIWGTIPSGGSGLHTYQWQVSSNNQPGSYFNIPGANKLNYNSLPANVTLYYRRVVSSGTCAPPSESDPVAITVIQAPSAPLLTDQEVDICRNSTAAFTINSPQPGIIYNWYADIQRITLLNTGTTFTTGTLTQNTTYYVEAVNESSNCASLNTTPAQVFIKQPATAPEVDLYSLVCPGAKITLNVNNIQPGVIYKWYTQSTGGTSVFTGTSFNTQINNSITYYVEADNGCLSLRTPVTINVAALAQSPQIQDQLICPGTSAVLDAGLGDTITVNWYDAPSGGASLFTGPVFTTPQLNTNKLYYAEVTNAAGCITPTRSEVNITIAQQLAAPVASVGETTANSVAFNWLPVTGAKTYEVSIDNGQTFTNAGSSTNYMVSPVEKGQTVTLMVRALGDLPCQMSSNSTPVTGTAIDVMSIQVFVPNIFTPNGDGNNDVLYVRSPAIKSLTFYVYDQWGNLIFRSNNQSSGWDGTYKGSAQPVGVYVYYTEATLLDGKKINKKGTITLVR